MERDGARGCVDAGRGGGPPTPKPRGAPHARLLSPWRIAELGRAVRGVSRAAEGPVPPCPRGRWLTSPSPVRPSTLTAGLSALPRSCRQRAELP